MKLLFSSLLLLSTSVQSSAINIYVDSNKFELAKVTKNIFRTKYNIPKSLIRLKVGERCISRDKRFLELCINKKGELIQLPNYNLHNIINSLKTFKIEA